MKIPIYIGISERFKFLEGMTERSIRAHTTSEVEIIHLYPEQESGCTGFSDVRYTIERGIYFDVDMIVFGDVAELWAMRKPGRFVCMQDGSTEVAVIDCKHLCHNKSQQSMLPKSCDIPPEWNVEDFQYYHRPMPDNMKLLHFTALDTQPWFYEHPNPEMVEIYNQWK
jgi:hypothetical protein